MNTQLLVFENHLKSQTFDITEDQKKRILSLVDYTHEQYEVLSKITGLSVEYLAQDNVDYCVE